MKKYLSVDTEATGLEEGCYLIQVALVPIDVEKKIIEEKLGKETLVQCPSFEELKPNLNEWVLAHNEILIKEAHKKGLTKEDFQEWLANYLDSHEVREFFGKDEKGKYNKPVLFGKSLSALDIPLLTRYAGRKFMEAYFHHHTLDITCVAKALVDVGKLPPGFESTSKIIKHFGIREDARHTALSDAIDMANVYFKLLELIK